LTFAEPKDPVRRTAFALVKELGPRRAFFALCEFDMHMSMEARVRESDFGAAIDIYCAVSYPRKKHRAIREQRYIVLEHCVNRAALEAASCLGGLEAVWDYLEAEDARIGPIREEP
jgi:hypothetical protein